MNLVVETGLGLPNANSYIDESDALAGLPSSFMEEWIALTQDERNDRLIIASQFIDTAYQWVGTQKTLEQGLAWPRVGVMYQGHEVPDNIVPRAIKRASVMALILVLTQGIDVFRSTGELLVKKEKLAVMETEYFEPGKLESYGSGFEDIDNLLKGFYVVQTTGGGVVTAEVLRA